MSGSEQYEPKPKDIEEVSTPEASKQEGGEVISKQEVEEIKEMISSVEREEDVRQIAAEELEDLSPEAQKEVIEEIEALEEEYFDEADQIQADAAEDRLKIIKDVLEFLDLDTKEKAAEFAAELIPFVGAVYAVCGKRLKIEKDPQTNRRNVTFEKISNFDRVLYLAGELMASGHVLKGAKKAIAEKGAKKAAAKAAKEGGEVLAKRAGEKLLVRAKEGVEREFS
ncbi:MAG: hypothetical protein ABEJ24_01770 [Candidatus Magasanikbacteria bacterium]